MTYGEVTKGIFVSRPNRFIANVEIDGKIEVCHVKNTGRCKEILIEGATVVLEKSQNPNRKTKYDLIGVYKGTELINIDSVAPNKVFGEWAIKQGYFGKISFIKPEKTYKKSRFDYYIESGDRKIFVEVKGVTLENDGVVSFPDAPTLRGIKHLNELAEAKANGYEAFVFFVIQMKNCKYFTPNTATHKAFADALKTAKDNGVEIRCVNCNVWENKLEIHDFIEAKI